MVSFPHTQPLHSSLLTSAKGSALDFYLHGFPYLKVVGSSPTWNALNFYFSIFAPFISSMLWPPIEPIYPHVACLCRFFWLPLLASPY
jgi:hypothetical protein